MTHRRQADGSTRAHAQVHRKLLYGHQGIMHISPHHIEAACCMGPHGYRLTCLEVHFRCQLRIASAQPILGPSGPCARVVVHVYVELFYGLTLACIPSGGLLRLAWQQLDSCIVNLGAGWPHTVPRPPAPALEHCAAGVCPVAVRWSQESKWDLQPIPMTQYLLLDVYCKD